MKRPTIVPSLPGKLASEVPGFLDYVFYYYIDDIEGQQVRCLRTTRTDSIAAKARMGIKSQLPEVIGNPTMKSIYDLIRRSEPISNIEAANTLEGANK